MMKNDMSCKRHMKRLLTIIVCLIVLSLGWSADSIFAASPKPSDASMANNAFAFDVFKKIIQENKGKNIFFSPYSISTAFTMTYAGARGNTAKEMAAVFHLSPLGEDVHKAFYALTDEIRKSRKEGIQLSVANALWSQKGMEVREEFKGLIARYYAGEFKEVDFRLEPEKSKMEIDLWVEVNTVGKIKELFRNISKDTGLIIASAIYFKGDWASKFDKGLTKKEPFYVEPGKPVDVQMMSKGSKFSSFKMRNKEFLYGEPNKDLQILELPYKGDELSMIILLPRTHRGLKVAEDILSPAILNDWLSELSKREVIVSLPKFKFTSVHSLKEILKAMGISKAFKPYQADFSGIFKRSEEYVTDVTHKAYIEVNEEGTEAAAATAMGMVQVSALPPPPPVYFKADRPFIFLIHHKPSNAILFLGRVMGPNEY
ncbi:MAG: serpin family protein [Syntrophaceae bacterium]|nr:serpin family protein [Syntrophaceae bacterium]